MGLIIRLVVGLVAAILLGSLAWGAGSQRRSLPCPTWLSWLVELDNPVFRGNSAKAILSHLELTPGMKVLDVGCGPGRLTVPAAAAVGPAGEVTAVDIQEGMLARAQAKAGAAGLANIAFRQMAIGQGGLEVDRYDRALLVTVLGEIPQPEGALAEIARALKPGGMLSVTEVIADPHFQPRSKVRRLAAAAGLREAGYFGHRLAFTLNFTKP
jgi:ubiquinone/menaquinone biosynthesis C-methylase UbiE